MDAMNLTAVLIPAYEPDERLPKYVHELFENGAGMVVVVNDGSSEKCACIFDQIERNDKIKVIQYEQNHGKGYALRTGLGWIRDNTDAENTRYIVTADADGQHKVEDVVKVAEAVQKDENALWLGSRDFSQPDVPFKSRNGNRITSVVFKLLYGQWVSDTQTGLRGFERKHLSMMCNVQGDRYEYEMKVLIECSAAHIPMKPITIQTVYENNNEGSHFHAFRDSFRIYRVILGQFLKFVSTSLLCTIVDYSVFLLVNWILEKNLPQLNYTVRFLVLQFMLRITIATAVARIISSFCNFLLNRSIVFKNKTHIGKKFIRFVCVVLLNLVLSAGFTSTLHLTTQASEQLLKIPVDVVLFMLSYTLQRTWVFKKGKDGE